MDGIARFVAMCDAEFEPLELFQTIPQSTPRGRCDKIRKEMQHRRDDSSRSALDAVKWKKLALGSLSPETGTVFNVRPNLRLVKLQVVCRHEILSRSTVHAKLFRGQFGLLFQVTTKLYIILAEATRRVP
ncbi:unnamed protein product [Parnassius mnemosyne]|uniref:Uncharacterized protein n=1 Tax=Parnassius mnemosyne TaxID=213953 RepID=A0AAV1LTS4_9NEOP